MHPDRPRILLLSMYPLDRGMWGPTVRIANIRDELAELVDLDVVAGYRGARRVALARYAVSGRARGLDGVYVESSTFLPAEADVAFLGLVRALGVPVLTFFRDAYQLFDEYYTRDTLRRRLSAAAFRPSVRALRAVSSMVAVPTAGLGHALFGHEAPFALLPPGAPPPVDVPRDADANRLLFVGDARLPAQGAPLLIDAVERARARGIGVELDIVSRPGQEPMRPHPAWMRVHRAEGDAIHALLPGVLATVIPRPRNAYNDLALPIKLFEYLAYGRPLLVTDCTEQARVVREADAGLVVSDAEGALADGIARMAQASFETRATWSRNAAEAARDNSWARRAEAILALLGSDRR